MCIILCKRALVQVWILRVTKRLYGAVPIIRSLIATVFGIVRAKLWKKMRIIFVSDGVFKVFSLLRLRRYDVLV